MPEIPNVVSGEPVESSWGNDIRDRSVQKYADQTALDFSQPLPQLGELAWLINPGWLVVCTDVVAPATWTPLLDRDQGDDQWVNITGDTMTGALTVQGSITAPNVTATSRLIGTLQGRQEVKAGYTSLSAELPIGGAWQTIAESEAWLTGVVNYFTTMAGTWLLNGTDLQTWGSLRVLRRTDQAVLATSLAGPGLTLAAGAFRGAGTLATLFPISAGDAFVYQASRQGSGTAGSVRIQTMGIEMRPVWDVPTSVEFKGAWAP